MNAFEKCGVQSAQLTELSTCTGPSTVETDVLESIKSGIDPLTPPGGFRPRRYRQYHREDSNIKKRMGWQGGLFKWRRLLDDLKASGSFATNEEVEKEQSLQNDFEGIDDGDDHSCLTELIYGLDENTEFIDWEETTVSGLESEIESNSSTILESAAANCADDESDGSDSPLYEGARLTVSESLLLTMTFAVTYNLTGEALSSLLLLLNLHYLHPNKCLPSLYKFKKYFENLKI